ncbi:unnamed protein product [Blepharisma stoltei]|uniref:Uncharacterized protein n=1 Tax=Blepharisma stoltei TaxID=1481888 RepID=A0AAU9K2T2_9CILI|nr:unnamed protein product [Blepharisma stoltei]
MVSNAKINQSGNTVLAITPIEVPSNKRLAICITKSHEIKGRSLVGCRFGILKAIEIIAPPQIIAWAREIAEWVSKLKISNNRAIIIVLPPTPPALDSRAKIKIRKLPPISWPSRGARPLWMQWPCSQDVYFLQSLSVSHFGEYLLFADAITRRQKKINIYLIIKLIWWSLSHILNQ